MTDESLIQLRVLRKSNFTGDRWEREDVLQYAMWVPDGCGGLEEEWHDVPIVREDDL